MNVEHVSFEGNGTAIVMIPRSNPMLTERDGLRTSHRKRPRCWSAGSRRRTCARVNCFVRFTFLGCPNGRWNVIDPAHYQMGHREVRLACIDNQRTLRLLHRIGDAQDMIVAGFDHLRSCKREDGNQLTSCCDMWRMRRCGVT